MLTRDDVAQRLGLALMEALELAAVQSAPAAEPSTPTPLPLRLLTLDEVAQRVSLSVSSVKAMVGREFEPVHQGRTVRVASDEVDAYINRLRGRGSQRPQGEPPAPIDIGRTRRRPRAASSAASSTHRAASNKKASESR